MTEETTPVEAHAGTHAVAIARAHGVEEIFTLSGAHVFPIYDGAVHAEPPMPLIDVRHEQTAAFAAEAMGKLTRRPGVAVLTAGPGVTNGISAITQAHFAGSPLVVIGGRSPANRWGTGALQELDQPPLVDTVTKLARTLPTAADVAPGLHEALTVANAPHRGPVFVDVPMDELFNTATSTYPTLTPTAPLEPDSDALAQIATLLGQARQPVLILGTDVWADRAETAAFEFVQELKLPVITNGMGRGLVPGGHPLLMTKARGKALSQADLVIVVGTPLDFRLSYGVFGSETARAKVVHIADSPDQLSTHAELAASAAGDLSLALRGIADAFVRLPRHPDWSHWVEQLSQAVTSRTAEDALMLQADSTPIHPARIYGELLPRLANDAIIVGDGGDFVSFAGRFVEPQQPGNWLDTGPYGCLGAGMGAAIAARLHRPNAQVVVLYGDGAAGMSLMDVDTLVRHNLPVVMVMGNNSTWGLEKHPMQMLYGYDVVADLGHQTRYDEVVKALGGAGEMVTEPDQIGPALDRAFAANVPYLVNIITDIDIAYPRRTFGV